MKRSARGASSTARNSRPSRKPAVRLLERSNHVYLVSAVNVLLRVLFFGCVVAAETTRIKFRSIPAAYLS